MQLSFTNSGFLKIPVKSHTHQGGLRITGTTAQDYHVRDVHSVPVVILGSAANYGHVLFRNCAAFVEKEGVCAHRKNQKRIEKQKRKVVTMLVTIVTLFAICWLPAHVNNFLLMFNFKVHSCLHNSLILIFYFLNHSDAVINSCLYLVFNESFSEGFKHRNRSKIV